ncbi:MAG TPA: SAM-dependent methyltransferase [Cyanobacteria bacterium UBA9273]|nr:SAM-dependent methyltransferase [Cyanobacteria bacterium UBA9273]
MSDTLTKLAYQTFQQGKSVFALAHKSISSQLMNLVYPPVNQLKTQPVSPEILLQFRQKLEQIQETDWQDAERGVYPESLLFDNPWADFLRYYPEICLDLPRTWERTHHNQFQDFSPDIETDEFPSYYRRNFHYQTDGYLSDTSANLYDLQVEILFNGAADPMRRRILFPLKEGLKAFDSVSPKQIRVLDVACGTGRTLRMIRGTLPQAALFGIDLSPAYLRKANQLLSDIPGELPQLLQAKAEELPYRDNYFHGISCVFLFHELPPSVRQRAIEQCFRVMQPGGIFVICDSIQAIDFPQLKPMMDNFPVMFHEPYYRHYITDDLVKRLEQAGFEAITTQNHFMSKYWIARKP